jgi:stage III sporulation protein AA
VNKLLDIKIKEILPYRMIREIEKRMSNDFILEEIRIRLNRQAYIVLGGMNIIINYVATDDEMLKILKIISHYSLYAYKDTLSQGYISLDNGIRVGVIGRASVEGDNIIGVYNISEFVIRLPHIIDVECNEIVNLSDKGSLLIYSPPGVGKTTLLRSMIQKISQGYNAKRSAVIDTRGELSFNLDNKDLLVSILSGYPRKKGIEIAVRTMNAQIIFCDEIGDEQDASAIIDAQGAGIPLIASCHGSSLKDIFSHSGIYNLHKAKIFEYYVGIKRGCGRDFLYQINTWSEADGII